MENQTSFKKISKIIIIIIIFLVVAVVGYLAGGIIKYGFDIRKSDKVTENFQNALEQPYKDDVYGGKTPEETWAMYIDALKNGNIELASKYYAVGSMNVPIDSLYEKKQNGQLEGWIKELETLEEDNHQTLSKDKKYYFYNYFNEKYQQTLSSSVIFYLNPYTEVWKIINL